MFVSGGYGRDGVEVGEEVGWWGGEECVGPFFIDFLPLIGPLSPLRSSAFRGGLPYGMVCE